MKRPINSLILTAAVAAVSVLLLTGCKQENGKKSSSQKEAEIQIPAYNDTSEMDEETRHRIILIKSAQANGHTEK